MPHSKEREVLRGVLQFDAQLKRTPNPEVLAILKTPLPPSEPAGGVAFDPGALLVPLANKQREELAADYAIWLGANLNEKRELVEFSEKRDLAPSERGHEWVSTSSRARDLLQILKLTFMPHSAQCKFLKVVLECDVLTAHNPSHPVLAALKTPLPHSESAGGGAFDLGAAIVPIANKQRDVLVVEYAMRLGIDPKGKREPIDSFDEADL